MVPGPEQGGPQEMPESDQDPWSQGIQHPGPVEGWGLSHLVQGANLNAFHKSH